MIRAFSLMFSYVLRAWVKTWPGKLLFSPPKKHNDSLDSEIDISLHLSIKKERLNGNVLQSCYSKFNRYSNKRVFVPPDSICETKMINFRSTEHPTALMILGNWPTSFFKIRLMFYWFRERAPAMTFKMQNRHAHSTVPTQKWSQFSIWVVFADASRFLTRQHLTNC